MYMCTLVPVCKDILIDLKCSVKLKIFIGMDDIYHMIFTQIIDIKTTKEENQNHVKCSKLSY